jgi:hypothetical protein
MLWRLRNWLEWWSRLLAKSTAPFGRGLERDCKCGPSIQSRDSGTRCFRLCTPTTLRKRFGRMLAPAGALGERAWAKRHPGFIPKTLWTASASSRRRQHWSRVFVRIAELPSPSQSSSSRASSGWPASKSKVWCAAAIADCPSPITAILFQRPLDPLLSAGMNSLLVWFAFLLAVSILRGKPAWNVQDIG